MECQIIINLLDKITKIKKHSSKNNWEAVPNKNDRGIYTRKVYISRRKTKNYV